MSITVCFPINLPYPPEYYFLAEFLSSLELFGLVGLRVGLGFLVFLGGVESSSSGSPSRVEGVGVFVGWIFAAGGS